MEGQALQVLRIPQPAERQGPRTSPYSLCFKSQSRPGFCGRRHHLFANSFFLLCYNTLRKFYGLLQPKNTNHSVCQSAKKIKTWQRTSENFTWQHWCVDWWSGTSPGVRIRLPSTSVRGERRSDRNPRRGRPLKDNNRTSFIWLRQQKIFVKQRSNLQKWLHLTYTYIYFLTAGWLWLR